MMPIDGCNFTGLETVLVSLVSAFIACVALLLGMTKKFVMKSECGLQHKNNADSDAAIRKEIAKVALSQNLTFMMLRAIIVHLDLPPDKKAYILNMTANRQDE